MPGPTNLSVWTMGKVGNMSREGCSASLASYPSWRRKDPRKKDPNSGGLPRSIVQEGSLEEGPCWHRGISMPAPVASSLS